MLFLDLQQVPKQIRRPPKTEKLCNRVHSQLFSFLAGQSGARSYRFVLKIVQGKRSVPPKHVPKILCKMSLALLDEDMVAYL